MTIRYVEGFDAQPDRLEHRQAELDELQRVSRTANGRRVLSAEVVDRARDIIHILPFSLPAAKVKGLADGTAMLYWNRTNLSGYDHYDELKLHIEVMPSCRVSYDWTIKPGPNCHNPIIGTGGGILRTESHVIKLLDTSARHALLALAPHAVIPQRGIEVRDEKG